MLGYDVFDDRGETRWLPYLMYFHRAGFRSDVINTDTYGFRYSHGPDGLRASVGSDVPHGPVRLLAGSSTPFGIGATGDAATLASRLWSAPGTPGVPWLNFSGRSFNSAQELLLFTLYRHLLPARIDHIVVFSGLNDLALARLPRAQRGDHGGFFNCGEYFDAMEKLREPHRKQRTGLGLRGKRRTEESPAEPVPPLAERIDFAVELTSRHLQAWRLLAAETGARITYVLQPLATWIRQDHAPQEKLVFAELDARSNFWGLYGDIATVEAARTYADRLGQACAKQGIGFFDINPRLAEVVTAADWLFVDRAHFTDHGNDVVAGVLTEALDLA
jgi:hypothetical protein